MRTVTLAMASAMARTTGDAELRLDVVGAVLVDALVHGARVGGGLAARSASWGDTVDVVAIDLGT